MTERTSEARHPSAGELLERENHLEAFADEAREQAVDFRGAPLEHDR